MDDREIYREVFIRNELGLHARPAALLAQEANKFESQIKLVVDENEVDAKSVLDILSLAAARGCKITLKAYGPDAEKAMDHLENFFREGFGEN